MIDPSITDAGAVAKEFGADLEAGLAALCLAHIWPPVGTVAMGLAFWWTGLVAVSRLVLGVHWPLDVLAAICLGSSVALSINVAFDFFHAGAGARKQASE